MRSSARLPATGPVPPVVEAAVGAAPLTWREGGEDVVAIIGIEKEGVELSRGLKMGGISLGGKESNLRKQA